MESIFDHMGLVFLAVVNLNGAWYYYKLIKFLKYYPEYIEESKSIVLSYFILGNLPCIIMIIAGNTLEINYGIPILFSNPTEVFGYLFHTSIWLIWVVIGRWIFTKNGADFISKYRPYLSQFRDKSNPDPILLVKLVAAIAILGNCSVLIAVYLGYYG
jgi:hypothetical protein